MAIAERVLDVCGRPEERLETECQLGYRKHLGVAECGLAAQEGRDGHLDDPLPVGHRHHGLVSDVALDDPHRPSLDAVGVGRHGA